MENTALRPPPHADKGFPGFGWSRSTHIGNYDKIHETREDKKMEPRKEKSHQKLQLY
jgi:hypothetical protein